MFPIQRLAMYNPLFQACRSLLNRPFFEHTHTSLFHANHRPPDVPSFGSVKATLTVIAPTNKDYAIASLCHGQPSHNRLLQPSLFQFAYISGKLAHSIG